MDLDAILADPPPVHDGPASGVWSADRSLYDFLLSTVSSDSRTLETGLGVSTALFASIGSAHVCVVGDPRQVERLQAWGRVDLSRVTFEAEPSDQVLPRLTQPLDFVLIDGGHGFPTPILDWYYTSLLLVPGGITVVDDVQLPSVQFLTRYLDADPRWTAAAGVAGRWKAYRRGDQDMREEWQSQEFLGRPDVPLATRIKVGVNRLLPARWRR
jgi:hypothetical protein